MYISEANKEVSAATNTLGKKSPYLKLTPEKKADSGKYAAENGIKSVVRHLSIDNIYLWFKINSEAM